MKRILLYLLLLFVVVSCSDHPSEPANFGEVDCLPDIFPDYCGVTVPANIAPLNFMLKDGNSIIVAKIVYPGGSKTYGSGNKVQINEEDWMEILASSRGKEIEVIVYSKNLDSNLNSKGAWVKHIPFTIHVAEEEIDPWLSYRLIEPSYVAYENLDIMQRDLSSFNEEIIASNHIGQHKEQCINCHSYQNYHTDNMLFHVRGEGGGTMLIYQGKSKLMNALKRNGMISNPVYPAWHPTLPLIAFSTNKTGQLFYTQDTAKVEVQDTESHLVIYDVERDSMILVPTSVEEFENFPTWSPDGKKIYYTSMHFVAEDTTCLIDREMAYRYQEIKYNLYVRDFDADSLKVSERRLVLDLASQGQSASLPHVSPDGKSLIYASGAYGCFHIWHNDADIHLLDLETMQVDSLTALNSSRAESYPTWSSNGRWIIMASRRDDSNYSRVYISYFDADGHAHKAFALPHKDPECDKLLLRSYNRPETMVEKVNGRKY